MRWPALAVALSVFVVVGANPASAQEDDLLAPLVPTKGKGKGKSKPKPVVKKKFKPVKRPGRPGSEQKLEEDLLVPLTPPAKTELLVRVSGGVQGAKLFLDGTEMGTLPLSPMEVAPGEHLLVVRRPGYADFQTRVVAAAGKPTEVVAYLEAVGGLVSVVVNVAGAEVYVNDKSAGVSPLAELVLAPGTYQVRARKPGYSEARQTVLVRAGSQYRISLELTGTGSAVVATADRPERPALLPSDSLADPVGLGAQIEPEPPLYTRWYVWVGAAAVVAAATAGAVVAVRNAPQPGLDPHRDVCRTGPCAVCVPASRCAGP